MVSTLGSAYRIVNTETHLPNIWIHQDLGGSTFEGPRKATFAWGLFTVF